MIIPWLTNVAQKWQLRFLSPMFQHAIPYPSFVLILLNCSGGFYLIGEHIFLSYSLAFAEVLKASAIFIGVNSVDYSGIIKSSCPYF